MTGDHDMEEKSYTETDWLLFRNKIAGWQEKYMERLNREYVILLTGDGLASDKFWELEKRIREDKTDTGVVVDMRRSMLIFNISNLLSTGVLTLDDLDEFSEGLKERMKYLIDKGL